MERVSWALAGRAEDVSISTHFWFRTEGRVRSGTTKRNAALIRPIPEPFIFQDGVHVLIGPLPLEPYALQEVSFPAQAHPLQQRPGRLVPAVCDGEDSVEFQGFEGVVQQARDGFRGEPLPLMFP